MADSYIQVAPDSTGKLMQTYLNTLSGNAVHAEAVSLVDTAGNPINTLNVNVVGGLTVNANFAGTINVSQSNASNLAATVSQGGTWNIGTVTSITNPVTVAQSNASNFLATVSGTVTAIQGGTWNIGTITNPGNVGTKEIPDATSTYAPSIAASTAYANNLIIKASPGVLYNLTGYNSKNVAQFMLLLNATSVLGDGNAPNFPALNVPAGQTFSLSFGGKFGRFFSTGIVICNSSTANTKTIGSADCWFDALYS